MNVLSSENLCDAFVIERLGFDMNDKLEVLLFFINGRLCFIGFVCCDIDFYILSIEVVG